MGTCKSGCFTSQQQLNNHASKHSSVRTQSSSKTILSKPNTTYQLREYIPHFDGDEWLAWSEVLKCLKKEVKRSCEEMDLLGHQFVYALLARFEKYHFSRWEQLQFMSLFYSLIQLNYSSRREKQSLGMLSQFGRKFRKFQQKLQQKHKSSLEHFKFLTGQHHQKKHYHLARFSQLQFSMSMKQIQNVAGIVRAFCQQDMGAFALLTMYFRICVEKNVNNLGVKKLEESYVEGLRMLQKEYGTIDVDERIVESCRIKIEEVKQVLIQQEVLVFEKGLCSNLQQVKNFITKKQQNAKQDINILESYMRRLCNTHGEDIKIQMRFKNVLDSVKLFEILNSLIIDQKYTQTLQKSRQQVSQRFRNKNQMKQGDLIDISIEMEQQIANIQNSISQYLQRKTCLKIRKIGILVESCTFTRIQNLLQTANSMIQLANRQHYLIVKITDRLKQIDKDIVLLIQFPHTCVQIQLILRQNSISNLFHQRIQQLLKSHVYTPLTNLFVLNKKWSEQFFTQIFAIIDSISHYTSSNSTSHSSLRTSHDFEFIQMTSTFIQFSQKYLDPFKINMIKSEQQKYQQMSQVLHKIKQIKSLVKYGKYPIGIKNYNKSINYQKLNHIMFFYSMDQYHKAFELLQNIKSPELQMKKQALQLYGDILSKQNSLNLSEDAYAKCLKLYQRDNEVYSLSYVKVLGKLGDIQELTLNYLASLKHYEQSYTIMQALSLQNSQIDTSIPLIKIGHLYFDQQKFKKAIQYFMQVLKIREHKFGPLSLEYAEIIECIAKTYQTRKYHDQALEYNKKCLVIYQLIHGKQSMDCADILNRLGASYLFRANYKEAKSSYLQSLKIRQRVRGKDTIDCVPSLSSLGSVYEKCSQYKQALPYFKKCLSIVERTYGKNALQCVRQLNNIIVVFYHMQKFQQAIVFGLKCLEIQENIKGKQSIDCSGTLFGMSLGYEKLQLSKEAIVVCKRSYEIRLKELGVDHQLTIEVGERLQDLQSANVSIFLLSF